MKPKSISRNLYVNPDLNLIVNKSTGESVNIEPRLTSLLMLLLEARGKVVSRNELIIKIWGNYNSGEQLLTHSIAMLRKVVGKDRIKTIPKTGYMIEYEASHRYFSLNSAFQSKTLCWMAFLIMYLIIRLSFPHH